MASLCMRMHVGDDSVCGRGWKSRNLRWKEINEKIFALKRKNSFHIRWYALNLCSCILYAWNNICFFRSTLMINPRLVRFFHAPIFMYFMYVYFLLRIFSHLPSIYMKLLKLTCTMFVDGSDGKIDDLK